MQTYCKLYSFSGFEKIVQKMRKEIGLALTFTLDACRHGGMTELEEAELTDGQGRALSAHSEPQAYEGTQNAHRSARWPQLANVTPTVLVDKARTEFQNDTPEQFQNGQRQSANS